MRIEWAGEVWRLLPERAVWWARARAVIVADVHLGKPAAFRAAGVPVPEQATAADLSRLSELIHRFDAERLLILGDMLHARAGRTPETMEVAGAWRTRHPSLAITLVRGNHDVSSGDPPCEWGVECVDEPLPAAMLAQSGGGAGVLFAHHPPEEVNSAPAHGPVMHGHVHPCVVLDGPACSSLRAACFWFGSRAAVLPAFGSFTGAHQVRPRQGDRVFVIGDGEVAEAQVKSATAGCGPGPGRERVSREA